MRLLIAIISAASALTAACDGDSVRISSTRTETDVKGVLKVIETLQCPETIGVLTRKGSAHAGGEVCVYSGPRGAEVSLHLVKLGDEPVDTVLKRFEQALAKAMPRTAAELEASRTAAAAQEKADAARVEADAAQVDATAAAGAADAARLRASGVAIASNDDSVEVRLPGMSVDTEGDKASVRFGNFSINADDSSQSVDISSSDESVSVQAHDDAAEIRTRAPGDAVRVTYLLTDNRPAEAGWRLVGYEARGPVGGPVVIATVRAKERDSDGVFDSAKDLVTLNVGE